MEWQRILALHLGKFRGWCDDIMPSSDYRPALETKLVATTLLLGPKNKRQGSVNDFWPCIIENARAVRHPSSIISLSAAFLGKTSCKNIASMSSKWTLMECQGFLAVHHRSCKGCAATLMHNRTIGRLSRQNVLRQHCFYALKMSVNGVSTTFGHVSWKINWLSGDIKT
jgi:hypothetical protein